MTTELLTDATNTERQRRKPNSLYLISPYISWCPGYKEITLDGEFTLEELKDIVQHMEKHKT